MSRCKCNRAGSNAEPYANVQTSACITNEGGGWPVTLAISTGFTEHTPKLSSQPVFNNYYEHNNINMTTVVIPEVIKENPE